jgi:hypothetical protein
MKTLKKLSAVVVLTFALALSAFAGETPTQPCGDPVPGQTETPPCATQLLSGNMTTPATLSITPGIMGKPAGTNETSLTRIVADVLLNFLPLF